MGSYLDGEPPGYLAHGPEYGKPPFPGLHGLVTQGRAPAPKEYIGEVLLRGEVEERKDQKAAPYVPVLAALGLLYLDYPVRAPVDLARLVHYPRPRGRKLRIGYAASGSPVLLNEYRVAGVRKRPDPTPPHCHPLF